MDIKNIIRQFVREIAVDPWQPIYRRKLLGSRKFHGWDARLDGYFWPRPGVDRHATKVALDPLIGLIQPLAHTARLGTPWDARQRADACRAANLIFHWGRVPQRPETITPENIRAVILAAVRDDRNSSAPMNSGWTKVAALATAQSDNPHVIWDSRVSNSIVRRLDNWFHECGITRIPTSVDKIGIVTGQGGTRRELTRHLDWPIAYGRWSSQVAASEFVRRVCAEVNTGVCPDTNEPWSDMRDLWTVREIEMVLFMDGY